MQFKVNMAIFKFSCLTFFGFAALFVPYKAKGNLLCIEVLNPKKIATFEADLRILGHHLIEIPDVANIQVTTAYNGFLENFTSHFEGTKPKSTSEILAQRYSQHDEAAQSTLKLGFTLSPDKKGILAPQDWQVPIKAIVSQLALNVKLKKIKPNEILYPTFFFKNSNSSDSSIYVPVRPFIDSWPNLDQYRLMTGDKLGEQLPANIFNYYAARGYMPFFPGKLLEHEIAHFTELTFRPALMSAVREDLRKKQINRDIVESDKELVSGKSLSEIRSFAIGEFFSLPNIDQDKKIRKLWSLKKISKSARSQRIEQMGNLERKVEIEKILSAFQSDESLLIRMGGGSRDSYNLEQELRYSLARILSQVEDVDYSTYTLIDKSYRVIANENLHGILSELQVLYTLIYELDSKLESLNEQRKQLGYWEKFKKMDEAERNKKLKKMLVTRMIQLEAAFVSAIELKITPEQVVRDNTQDRISRSSATYRYLKSFVLPNTYLHRAFLSDHATQD